MNRIIILFLISFVTVTGLIAALNPKMQQPVRFAAANMGIENVTEEVAVTKSPIIEDTGIEIQEVEIKPQLQKTEITQKKVKVQPQKTKVSTQSVKIQPQKTQIKEKQVKVTPQKNQTTKTPVKTQTQKTSQTVKNVKTPVELPKSIQEIVKNETPKTPQPQPQKQTTVAQKTTPTVTLPKQQEEPKTVLTEEEEVILWNKWRSDLQNQVMKDSRIAAPMGTRFRFSFTVDKFGNISNLRVWSDTPYFTPMAVSSIKPVILSYQGKNILKFPKGTKRIQTNVVGGFVIATYEKYSKPDDYADVEKIRRLKNVQM